MRHSSEHNDWTGCRATFKFFSAGRERVVLTEDWVQRAKSMTGGNNILLCTDFFLPQVLYTQFQNGKLENMLMLLIILITLLVLLLLCSSYSIIWIWHGDVVWVCFDNFEHVWPETCTPAEVNCVAGGTSEFFFSTENGVAPTASSLGEAPPHVPLLRYARQRQTPCICGREKFYICNRGDCFVCTTWVFPNLSDFLET